MTSVKIPTTPQIQRLNAAVQRADELSGYRIDACEIWDLFSWLCGKQYLEEAREISQAAHLAHYPVDNTNQGD